MNDKQLLRYSKQIFLPEVDIKGQENLLKAHVLIIGVGGLGCAALMYLVAAGVRYITIVDFDRVDETNLHRQVVFSEKSVGRLKVEAAREFVQKINSDIQMTTVSCQLNERQLLQHCQQCDVIIDATDNFESRFLINRCSVKTNTSLISGAAIRFEGSLIVFNRKKTGQACYQCLYSDKVQIDSDSCINSGILGPTVGIIGVMQALECIKLITKISSNETTKLLKFDALKNHWSTFELTADPACPICS